MLPSLELEGDALELGLVAYVSNDYRVFVDSWNWCALFLLQLILQAILGGFELIDNHE